METIDVFVLEYGETLECWGKRLHCNCGSRTPGYGYYCCGCGRKIGHIHRETKEEYQERMALQNS